MAVMFLLIHFKKVKKKENKKKVILEQLEKRFMLPFPTKCAWISPVPTMDPQNMSLNIRVTCKQFTAHPTRKLICRNSSVLQLRVNMVLLELVSLQVHLSLHDPAAAVTVQRASLSTFPISMISAG